MVAPGAQSYRRLTQRSARMTIDRAVRNGPWLVIAPHPDDESLGPGSFLNAVSAAGGRTFVAFLTDGAGSHRDAPGWSPARLAWTRAEEARHALRILGVTAAPLHLGWGDADPHRLGDCGFERSVRSLVAWCRRRGVRSIAVTWSGEPHCDHEAASALGKAVARRLHARFYEYLVWGWTLADLDDRLRGYRASTIDVSRGRPRQRRAIRCHHSQTGGRIDGAREAFSLPGPMMELAARPRLVLLSRDHRHAS